MNGLNCLKWKTTVPGSGVVIWLAEVRVSIFITEGRYESGSSRPRTKENLTSALVNGVPSENFTPGRRWKVSVFAPRSSFQLDASWPV